MILYNDFQPAEPRIYLMNRSQTFMILYRQKGILTLKENEYEEKDNRPLSQWLLSNPWIVDKRFLQVAHQVLTQ